MQIFAYVPITSINQLQDSKQETIQSCDWKKRFSSKFCLTGVPSATEGTEMITALVVIPKLKPKHLLDSTQQNLIISLILKRTQ